jgi:hypothetical protein
MKIIYAVIAVCLSLQACNSQSNTPTGSINISEYSTLSEYIAAASMGDDDWYTAAVTASPANKPNWIENGVEFYLDGGHTAAVTVPTNRPLEDKSIGTSADFYVDEYNVGPVTPPAVTPTSYEDDYAMWTILPTAEYWIDTTNDDHTAAVSPAIKPIDGAEFEGTSRDDTDAAWSTVYYLVDFDPTATVTPKTEQIAPGFDDDEDGGLAFEETAPAVEATPWP